MESSQGGTSSIHSENIVIVTTTFYRSTSECRYQLAMGTFQSAVELGLNLVIVDGSPDQEVRDSLAALHGKRVGTSGIVSIVHVCREDPERPGMGFSRRQALFQGCELLKFLSKSTTSSSSSSSSLTRRVVLWLEPEKDDLIRDCLRIAAPIIEGQADLVVPFRTETSWLSYPEHQKRSEEEGNQRYTELIGRSDLDVYFGPVACLDSLVPQLALSPDPSVEGIADTYVPQYMATRAIRFSRTGAMIQLASVAVDFIYPLRQKKEEEDAGALLEAMISKRADQLRSVSLAHEIIMEGV